MKQIDLQNLAEKLWESYAEIFPRLVKFDCPKIILNNRLTKTAGYNISQDNVIHLAKRFFGNNEHEMLYTTLPHELAHQIDYNLNGWKVGDRHHNKKWQVIMVKIGLPPLLYHEMVL